MKLTPSVNSKYILKIYSNKNNKRYLFVEILNT